MNSTYASVMKWPLGSEPVEDFFSARVPSSSAEVRGIVIHNNTEKEGERQKEMQKAKDDEEVGK